MKKKKPKLPRVPLPRQTGGAHQLKTKKKPKHKKTQLLEDIEGPQIVQVL
ncbi:MAG: hypothetical protein AB7J46_06725 [Candidatus Altimarinota bacterium]